MAVLCCIAELVAVHSQICFQQIWLCCFALYTSAQIVICSCKHGICQFVQMCTALKYPVYRHEGAGGYGGADNACNVWSHSVHQKEVGRVGF